ncbi:MAG: hypothetical protein GY854_15300 [Deltaproteobacteria bacterium]|nr:hypothetical protein [Deltaproteobacteria bacterium]
MANKKKGASGKRQATRVDAQKTKQDKKRAPASRPEPEKPRIPERISEKDAGFGVIKVVIGVIIVLILGSMVLFNQVGGRESTRGDKLAGELCEETMECATGSVCYSYKGKKKRCMTRCKDEQPCDPGFTCVSATQQKRRKGIRVTDICVEDAQL